MSGTRGEIPLAVRLLKEQVSGFQYVVLQSIWSQVITHGYSRIPDPHSPGRFTWQRFSGRRTMTHFIHLFIPSFIHSFILGEELCNIGKCTDQ